MEGQLVWADLGIFAVVVFTNQFLQYVVPCYIYIYIYIYIYLYLDQYLYIHSIHVLYILLQQLLLKIHSPLLRDQRLAV